MIPRFDLTSLQMEAALAVFFILILAVLLWSGSEPRAKQS